MDLSGNGFFQKTGKELAIAFAAIPKHVNSLNLSDNYLFEKTGEELAIAFAAIPEQVNALKLSGNYLYKKTREELIQTFSSLPKTVTTLDLSYDALYKVPLSQLVALLQALPQSITYIDLSHNELFTHRTLPQRDKFLQALGPLRQNGRLNLTHNGENEASRAFLPLKTLARKHALPELVTDHILSFLTPMRESKISKKWHQLDVKLAQRRDVKLTQQKLLGCIKILIEQDSFWESKVRFPNQTTCKRPYGIQQINSLLKKLEGNPVHCFQEIIANCSARHSKNWQWAHHFFRGRDNTTNLIYGILKKVVITDIRSIEATIKSLNNLLTEHRINVLTNTSAKAVH